jgi:hypothetical protein
MTHRQHLKINQIWQIEKKKKKKPKKKLGCGSDWSIDRESHLATQTRDPPRAHATPPHRNPCKPTKNPQQTHCKQPP